MPSQSAFARYLDVHMVPDAGLETSIEATAEECASIARTIGIPAVSTLTGAFNINKRRGGCFNVEGTVRARITQTCVVSLDAFDSEIEAPIDVTFAPSSQSENGLGAPTASKRRSRRIEPQEFQPAPISDEAEPPDPIVDGRIDLGAVAVEFLTLALDFYPRKPGAQFRDLVTGDTGPSPSIFAALERFKDRS